VVGTYGFELLDGLPAPEAYDYFVWKGMEPHLHPYGACFHDLHNTRTTGLIEYLHVKGVTVVIVGGLALDYCVQVTVLQLLHHGFQVGVHLDACRGLDPNTIALAKQSMSQAGAVLLPSLPDLEQWITTLI
jgi:nicotinamidase/pyrazinamidase